MTDKNGNLESGDYITTCTIPGYGIRQNSGALMNYTVAKITMDCDFNPSIQPVEIILKDSNGENIIDSNGFLQWVNSENETELKYDIRYLLGMVHKLIRKIMKLGKIMENLYIELRL